MNNLTVGSIVSKGFSIGFKNLGSLIAALFLWAVTIWIPYINVGTTIALLAIVVAMSKGEIISPTEIFDSKYRKYMGEFFLLVGLMYAGIIVGYIFLVIPGIIISIAWSQALYLMIDKEINPIEALKRSNDMTYGKKWTIFGGILILSIIIYVILFILRFIGGLIADAVEVIFVAIGYLVLYPILLGANAHIYNELSDNENREVTEPPNF